jgi:hypothetical protein
MPNLITLYHGTIYEIEEVDVTKGQFNKDFGRGFYTSQDKSHAERLAVRNKTIKEVRYKLRRKKIIVSPWLYIYQFDTTNLDILKVKKFDYADRQWTRFIVLNRENKNKVQQHDYDVVIGPTANDNIRSTIQAFMPPSGGQVLTDRIIDALLSAIEPNKLPQQFFFGTQRAANFLVFKGKKKIQ